MIFENKTYLMSESSERACLSMGKSHSGSLNAHARGYSTIFHLCIDCRKKNSLLPAVTPAGSTNKGALKLMLLPKIDELCPAKRSKVLHCTAPVKWLLPHKIG